MIIERFKEQVRAYGEKSAIKTATRYLTYNDLDRLSNRYANLIKRAAPGGETGRIGILQEDPVDIVAGIFGTLKAGGIYVPMDMDMPVKRLQYMIEHAGIKTVLTDGKYEERIKEAAGSQNLSLIMPAHLDEVGGELAFEREVLVNKGASLLYTSGSTGQPKGVLQYHRNILYFIDRYAESMGVKPGSHMTLLASFAHDVTLLDMFSCLLNGAVMYPLNLKQDGIFAEIPAWLEREEINIWHSVPTVFRYFTASLTKKLFLPHLQIVVLGGEAVARNDIEKFNYFFSECPNCKMYLLYGQTESSYDSGRVLRLGQELDIISLGIPNKGTSLYVVDENGDEVDPLEVGEILVAGEHISPGYWQDEEKTRAKFFDDPDEGRIYYTGDLGRLLVDGTIEFLGRKDNQVKIRGYRIEMEEIEQTAMKYPLISEAGVKLVESHGHEVQEKFLALYFTANRDVDIKLLRVFLQEQLPDYMVPVYIKQLKKLPATVSGKIDRNALPVPEISLTDEYVAPVTELEKKLVGIWAEVLDIGTEVIGIDNNFFQLGGHSLRATVLTAKIHRELNVKVPLAEVFERQTIRLLAQFIEQSSESHYVHLDAVEKREYYPIAAAQRRMYFLQQLEPQKPTYNIPFTFLLRYSVNLERMEETFKQMISRHESLRTSFQVINDELVQRVHDQVDFHLLYFEVDIVDELKGVYQRLIAPFDLGKAPLFRAALVKSPAYIAMVCDFHHIIVDNRSLMILEKEFLAMDEGRELPELAFSYRDYVVWAEGPQRRLEIEKQEQYWLNAFSEEVNMLSLPYDYPAGAGQGFEGGLMDFRLDSNETANLKQLVGKTDATLFMVLLASLDVLLSRLSNQEDIVVGIPTAGRPFVFLQDIVGMFVNTLPLRNRVAGDMKFIDLVQQVKQNTIQAFENQEYPFDQLVEKLALVRENQGNPLFNVMFNMEDERAFMGDVEGMDMHESIQQYKGTSRFDLTFFIVDRGEYLLIHMEYSTRLFAVATVKRFVSFLLRIIADISADSKRLIQDISLMSEQEKERILAISNGPGLPCDHETSIYELFEKQVQQTPGAVALVGSSMKTGELVYISYEELDRQADLLAGRLTQLGVGPDVIVGIMIDRSVEMLVGMLGVLCAGGAYLPMDPAYPKERLGYMLADSGTRIVLGESNQGEKIDSLGIPVEMIDLLTVDYSKSDQGERITGRKNIMNPGLAYVIYTSGSTGRPKGVGVEHQGVVNLIGAFCLGFKITSLDHILLFASISFDASVPEIWMPWSRGGALYVMDRLVIGDYDEFQDYLERHDIDIITLPPTYGVNLDLERLSSLRLLITAGAPPPLDFVRECVARMDYINAYGPTENSVCTSYWYNPRGTAIDRVTIGTPLANNRLWVVDRYFSIQPFGIAGELCISGPGLARGYLNNPGRTAEKFITPSGFTTLLYKTGDLVRWLENGNLEFLGRMDEQVKVRGFRIEPGEIENILAHHPRVNDAIVLDRVLATGDHYLCAYVTADGIEPDELQGYLANILPDYMIPSFIMCLERFPLSPSGKVDRGALPGPELVNTVIANTPMDEIESRLSDIWARVLKIEREYIGSTANFFHMGGHSLKATILSAAIHREFHVKVPLADIFKYPTIEGLAVLIHRLIPDSESTTITIAEEKEYYPLSYNQKRLWFKYLIAPDSATFNIFSTILVELEQAEDVQRVETVIEILLQRYDSFRTSFFLIHEQPVQRIFSSLTLPFRVEDISSLDLESRQSRLEAIERETMCQPFKLEYPPLLRVVLVKLEERFYDLMICMHHIISDGWSMTLLKNEFSRLYEELPQGKVDRFEMPPIRYIDFAEWNYRKLANRDVREKACLYWKEKLANGFPVLQLPMDFLEVTDNRGASYIVIIDQGLTERLKNLTYHNNITLFSVMFSAFIFLLHRLSHQEEIVCSFISSGRDHWALQSLIGFFIEVVVYQGRLRKDERVEDFLLRIHAEILDAIKNQDYPLELICEELDIRFLETNVSFNMLNIMDNTQENIPGLMTPGHKEKERDAKFDLEPFILEYKNGILMDWVYKKERFLPQTIEYMVGEYVQVLDFLCSNPGQSLSEFRQKGKKRRLNLNQ